mmetsp:Transcript_1392/g.1599  ORF Transcript_1392/g.1599 Transcript_1392/m.1599 type:complete len:238 (+) Transcript_1392:65-778(+)
MLRCCRKRPSAAETQAAAQEAFILRELVTPEEQAVIVGRSRSFREEVKNLEELLDTRPVEIVATNLAGETLAELYLSVIATGADLERSIFSASCINAEEFTITMTYQGAIIPRQWHLFDVRMLPRQVARVGVVKAQKPQPDPALDRALFMQAWQGGGHVSTVQALLDYNADPNGYTFEDGDRAIHVSAGRGYAKVVSALLEARADVNGRGVAGTTPLKRSDSYPELQELLRAHGATR